MHAVAESNLSKIVWLLLFVVLVIFVGSFWPEFSQGYDVKTQARLFCNSMIRGKLNSYEVNTDDFVQNVRPSGVKLTPKQYSFTLKENRQGHSWICTFKASYPVSVEWVGIGQVLQEIPQYKFMKKIELEHEVSNTY